MKRPLLITGISSVLLSLGVAAFAIPQSSADEQPVLTPIQAEKIPQTNIEEEEKSLIPEDLPKAQSTLKKIITDTPVVDEKVESEETEDSSVDTTYVPDSNMNEETRKRAIEQYSKDYLAFNKEGLTQEQIDIVYHTAKHTKNNIPSAFFRAIGEQESNITPTAFAPDQNGGTWGTYQINEHEWKLAYGHGFNTDLNNNGTPDEQEGMIQAEYGAKYFDARYERVMKMREQNPDARWVKEMTPLESFAVAHNAGEGGMQKYPHFRTPAVTDKYLENMKTKIPLYTIR